MWGGGRRGRMPKEGYEVKRDQDGERLQKKKPVKEENKRAHHSLRAKGSSSRRSYGKKRGTTARALRNREKNAPRRGRLAPADRPIKETHLC